MLEAEMAYATNQDSMRLQEDMVSRLYPTSLPTAVEELKALERDIIPLQRVTPPFIRMDYGEAVKTLQGKGSTIQ